MLSFSSALFLVVLSASVAANIAGIDRLNAENASMSALDSLTAGEKCCSGYLIPPQRDPEPRTDR